MEFERNKEIRKESEAAFLGENTRDFDECVDSWLSLLLWKCFKYLAAICLFVPFTPVCMCFVCACMLCPFMCDHLTDVRP